MSGRKMLENAVFIRVCRTFGILRKYRHLLQKWGTDGVRFQLKWGMKTDSYN